MVLARRKRPFGRTFALMNRLIASPLKIPDLEAFQLAIEGDDNKPRSSCPRRVRVNTT